MECRVAADVACLQTDVAVQQVAQDVEKSRFGAVEQDGGADLADSGNTTASRLFHVLRLRLNNSDYNNNHADRVNVNIYCY